jgi:tetratricopeptide (TPR) repeat protein
VKKSIRCAKIAAILWLLPNGAVGMTAAQSTPSTKKQAGQESVLLDAAKREPGNLRVATSIGEYYLHEERWQESAHWLTMAYQLSGGSEQTGYELAFAQMQSGALESSKQQIEQLLARADTARLHNLLGEVEDRRASYLDAAREYHGAAELDPSETYIFDLATFLLQHKKYEGFLDGSIKFFRYGVSKYPKSSSLTVGLGVALYASEQYDDAVKVLCEAVDLNPDDRRPVEFLGKARKVSPELAAEVDRRLEVFAERYPENAATNYYYAFSLWQRGGGQEGNNQEKIERLLRKAETKAPKWYEPHYQLGVLYESEKRYGEAIQEMQNTVVLEPEFSAAHFQLAVLYSRTGDKQKAMREAAVVKRLKEKVRKSDAEQAVEK